MPVQSLPPFFDMLFTKDEGRLASDGYLYLDQQYQALNNMETMFNFSTSTLFVNYSALQAVGVTQPALLGINPPTFTTAQITALYSATDANKKALLPTGSIWYNSELDKLQFKGASAVQTITSV
jgi:hypothetical protein